MIKKNIPDIENIQYDLSFLKKVKWILTIIILFSFILFKNFSIEEKIDRLVFSSLTISRSCSIGLNSYQINFFPLPHINLSGLNIPGPCTGLNQAMQFKQVKAFFRGPSIFPIGMKFKISTKLNNNPIEFFVTAGLSSHVLEIKENNISFDKLNKYIPAIKLSGDIILDAYVAIENKEISSINLKLQSMNFNLPSQNIGGFQLKPLIFKNLFLSAITEDEYLNITQFVIGDENSPIRSDFKGNIKLNQRRPMSSALDLKGQVAVGEELLNEIFILKGYLGQFDKRDNFYQIKIRGSLSHYKLSSHK